MNWTIPGTTLTTQREKAGTIRGQFQALFLGGGIALSQVTSITGLDAYMIQNWVKRGFLSPPVGKRYTCRQFCRIVIINMLKSVLPMEKICALLKKYDIPAKDQVTKLWDILSDEDPCELVPAEVNEETIFDLPQLLEDAGIYLAGRREE